MEASIKNQTDLTIDEEATVKTIREIHENMVSVFETSGRIALSLAMAGESDLTLVQLIESARKSARRDGKQMTLAAPATDDLRAMLDRGGFVVSPESREFWLHEVAQ